MTDAQMAALWRQINKARIKYVNKYRKEWAAYYFAQMQTILANLSESDPYAKAFKLEDVEALFVRMYREVGADFGKLGFVSAKAVKEIEANDSTAASWSAQMEAYAKTYGAESIVSIADTGIEQAKALIRELTEEAIARGMSADELAAYIEAEVVGRWAVTSRFNAERIARTEVIAASNQGSFIGAQSTGLTLSKTWLTAIDGRERDAHRAANGQTVALEAPFRVDGEELNTPGDKRGSASNVINCRCAATYRAAAL